MEKLVRLEEIDGLSELISGLDDLVDKAEDCWCELSVGFCNHLHDGKWHWGEGAPTKAQRDMFTEIRKGVRRVLGEDFQVSVDPQELKAEMDKKRVSYTGEELSQPEQLSIEQVLPGLPPTKHGGAIPVTDWVDGRCRYYLENPEECLLEEFPENLPKLQGKIHLPKHEEIDFAKMLVDRGICRWIRSEKVLRVKGREVLNGMFGVVKPNKFVGSDASKPVLRLIMNLIPSNAVHKMIGGRTHELPHITRWCSVLVDEGEIIQVCQSDMTAAFYLFSLPACWSSHLSFNIKAKGREIGAPAEDQDNSFTLSCAVLPMGWSSAVGIMQFIAEEVLYKAGLPKDAQIRRTNPLPSWMLESVKEAKEKKKLWWHVYLDNYASGEKVLFENGEGADQQRQVEDAWEKAGIVVSQGKSIVDQTSVSELGAFIGGKSGWIGASTERLNKVAKVTLWLLREKVLSKKSLQVVMGRWIFILQFRRPAMSHFEIVWEFISGKRKGPQAEEKVREELLGCLFGMMLYHTFLGAKFENQITCSDASGTGGAIAISEELSSQGVSFLVSQEPRYQPVKVPIVVVSLFNGVGGVFRCFDLAGLQVVGAISVENHKPANRVTHRRWPWVQQYLDVREFGKAQIEESIETMGYFQEIHLWVGFPCTDLSSAKAKRENLAGRQSSLFYEALRIKKELKEVYPKKKFKQVFENVASMDIEARRQISSELECRPFRVDPRLQVPMSRPRFCWTDLDLFEVPGITYVDKGDYVEMEVSGTWPEPKDWLTEGWYQLDPSAIFPTCMKAIPRVKPPEQPAGIHRCDQRRSDNFKFPPYQYKSQYLLVNEDGQGRLLDCQEREQLMGFGKDHTSVCFSASRSKMQKVSFENERLSLIGDSFCCYSFMVFAAFAGYPWSNSFSLDEMNQRTGLSPGASSHVSVRCPLGTKEGYGVFPPAQKAVYQLNLFLAQRANHTGSDIRITTGQFLNPKQAARQSIIQLMRVRAGNGAKEARRARRQGIALEDRAITTQTRFRYFSAVKKVLPLLELHPRHIDETLCHWIEEQFAEGEGITGIGDALSGLHHFAPWVKGSTQGAWRLFRLWRKVERPQQAPPLPEAFAEALVSRALEMEDLNLAAALAVGFWGLLRTGEILALCPYQIMIGTSDIVLQLGLTKTGLRRHQDENVIIHHKPTQLLLSALLEIRNFQHTMFVPLIPGGGPRFREGFAKLLAFFSLEKRFRPYSLRRGGATAFFRATSSMEATLIKGRWGTSQAARQYIQEGLSVLTTLTITQKQKDLLQAYASQFACT
eukprot:Skav232830  [mRNA]  locus=scaffold2600:52216:56365:+ [translate_table: standard]